MVGVDFARRRLVQSSRPFGLRVFDDSVWVPALISGLLAATLQRLPGLRLFAPNAVCRAALFCPACNSVVEPANQPSHSSTRKRTTSRSECAFCLSTLCGVRFLVRPIFQRRLTAYSVQGRCRVIRVGCCPGTARSFIAGGYAAPCIRGCGPYRRGLAGCAALPIESLVATMLVLLAAAGLLRSRCGVSCCVGLNFRALKKRMQAFFVSANNPCRRTAQVL